MKPCHFNGRPVKHQSYDPVRPHHYILYANAIKYGNPCLNSLGSQSSGSLNSIGCIIIVLIFAVFYAELVKYVDCGFLDNDFVKHHAATPYTATHAQLPLVKGNPFACFRQIISRNQTRRAATNNCNICFDIF